MQKQFELIYLNFKNLRNPSTGPKKQRSAHAVICAHLKIKLQTKKSYAGVLNVLVKGKKEKESFIKNKTPT